MSCHFRRMSVLLSCLAGLLAVVQETPVLAVNASPHAIEVSQADGKPIQLRLRGNAHRHWYEDLSGYSVMRRSDRNYVYVEYGARGVWGSSDRIVGRDKPHPNAKKHLMPPRSRMQNRLPRLPHRISAAPRVNSTGNVKNLVILMRFADHASRTLPSQGDFNTIFNAVGGDPLLAPTGSVRDYYLENSYGQLRLNSTVYQWVTLPKPEAYYADGQSGLTLKITEAIREALELADSAVDFSQFDSNGDGWVDAIAFVHSGYGAEWGGSDSSGADFKDRIWSHRWSISPWASDESIKVSDYHINPGLWNTSGTKPGRIGVICHETGHFFGLPDLYDTSQAGEGIGSWGLMANSWGFDGSQLRPPHFSAWSKVFLGWINATPITAPGTFTINQVETTCAGQLPEVYRLDSGYSDGEYLLIENRQAIGFDAGIPSSGAGLAIWHVDEFKSTNSDPGYPGQTGWPQNNRHYMVSLLQADGSFHLERGDNRGDDGDMFRLGNNTSLTANSLPSNIGYQFGSTTVPTYSVEDISNSGSEMSFRIAPVSRTVSTPAFVGNGEIPSSAKEIFLAAQQYAATIAPAESPEYFLTVELALKHAELTRQSRNRIQSLTGSGSRRVRGGEHSIIVKTSRRAAGRSPRSNINPLPGIDPGWQVKKSILLSDPRWLANQHKLRKQTFLQERSLPQGNSSPGIWGGRKSHAGEFPHCVAIGSSSQFCCSGTVIGPRLVVTAGHCVAGNCRSRIYVGLDSNQPDPEHIFEVETVRLHPEFDALSLKNDIALLVLAKPLENVRACEIASEEQVTNASFVRLAGIGFTEFGRFGVQMTVDVSMSTTTCDSNDDQQQYGCHPNFEFVAGGNGVDSCNGDSGGPAYIVDGNRLFLAGATSRAAVNSEVNCGDGGNYVRVDRYRNWIEGVISEEGLGNLLSSQGP